MKQFFILITILMLGRTLYAAEPDALWERYIQAKIRFQNELADLLVESNPAFKDLIILSRDLQITMVNMRQQKYYYVLSHDPDRIVKDQGTSQWSNFEWTEDDNKKFMAASAEYAELAKAKNALQAKNQGNPDWPAARKAFALTMQSKNYTAIVNRLTKKTLAIDQDLKKTNKN